MAGWGIHARHDYQKDRKSSGGKKGGKAWAHRFDSTPTRVHLSLPETFYVHPQSGNEYPFRPGYRHWVPFARGGKGSYIECGEKCVKCAWSNPRDFSLDLEPDPGMDKVGHARPYYAVSAWIEEWFHVVQFYRDEKNPSQGTYFSRERCQGRGCEYCEQKVEKVFGKKIYSVFSPAYWRTLMELQEQLEGSCKCGGDLYVPDYRCSNCGEVAIDVCNTCYNCGSEDIAIDLESNEAECQSCQTTWDISPASNEKLTKEANQVHTCKSCGHQDYPVPTRVCSNEGNGCPGVDAYSIFDIQMTLSVNGSGKDASLTVGKWKIQEPDARLFDPKYQGDDSEWAEKIAVANKKAYNLDELLGEQEVSLQCQLLNVANPWAVGGGEVAHSRPRMRQ